jgi:hypothetical protein
MQVDSILLIFVGPCRSTPINNDFWIESPFLIVKTLKTLGLVGWWFQIRAFVLNIFQL